MAKSISDQLLEQTSPLDAIIGMYDLVRFQIPYLACVLNGRQCEQYLHLVSDDPQFTLANGRVEELFQREIDEERVTEMARQYLNAETANRPAFFNSITVALIPRSGDYPPPDRLKNDEEQYKFSKTFGPVRVSWDRENPGDKGRPPCGATACLYWNKLGVRAVAIDGQHRLAAIKRRAASDDRFAQSLGVSIIFLVLDDAFGVKSDKPRVELVRQLFIDLNKHAQKVSRARQLLLDDMDPIAIALRKMVGPELKFEKKSDGVGDLPIGTNGEFQDCLPLELVDWHGEQKAKVDRGPYATSILALEWAISSLCTSKAFGKRMPTSAAVFVEMVSRDEEGEDAGSSDYAKIRRFLKGWEKVVPELAGELDAAEDQEISYVPSSMVLKSMGAHAYEYWGRGLVYLLTRCGPYRRLADYRVSRGLLSAEFGGWHQVDSAFAAAAPASKNELKRKRDVLEARLKDDCGQDVVVGFKKSLDHINSKIKSVSSNGAEPEPSLLFFLTGQRALVLSLGMCVDVGDSDPSGSAAKIAEMFGWPRPASQSDKVVVFSKVIAEAIGYWEQKEKGYMFTKSVRCSKVARFPQTFWQGSILKRETPEAVDFSGIAAGRGARLICLMTALWLHCVIGRHCCKQVLNMITEWAVNLRGGSTALDGLEATPSGRHLKKALLSAAGLHVSGSSAYEANKFPFRFLSKMTLSDDPEYNAELDLPKLVVGRCKWLLGMIGNK